MAKKQKMKMDKEAKGKYDTKRDAMMTGMPMGEDMGQGGTHTCSYKGGGKK